MTNRFAAKCRRMLALCASVVAIFPARASELDNDWTTVSNLISSYSAQITSAPSSVVTTKFTGGQLLGNGDIGVAVGDTTSRQTFRFGKLDFWGSCVKEPGDNSDSKQYVWQQGAMSVGGLTLGSSNAGTNPNSVFTMTQDILNAEDRTTMQFGDGLGGNVTVSMTAWTADTDNVFVVELSSPPGANPVTLNLTNFVPHQYEYQNQWLDCSNVYAYAAGITNGIIWSARHNYVTNTDDDSYDYGSSVTNYPPDPPYNASVAMATEIIGANFTSTSIGTNSGSPGKCFSTGTFTLNGGSTIYIVTAIKSFVVCTNNGIGESEDGSAIVLMSTNVATLEATRDRAVSDVSAIDSTAVVNLKADHRNWWENFYLKSFVQLGDATMEKFYYGSLYVIGCNFRTNKIIPPGLWGVWSMTDTPMWGGRYTQNYNFEAPTYGICSANHPELLAPYICVITNQLPRDRFRTHAAGWDGTEFRRSLTPYWVFATWTNNAIAPSQNNNALPARDQKSNGSFSAMPLIWYYEYTQDTNYLAQVLYPHLRELDTFWRSYMTTNSKPYSIQHSSTHEDSSDLNPDSDLGFCKEICRTLIGASQLLNRDANMIPVWQDVLTNLADFPTTVFSNATVFAIAQNMNGSTSPTTLFEYGNQPVNMEGQLFPGENIYLGGDVTDLQIASNSIALMNCWSDSSAGSGSQNNGFPKIWPMVPRIGWPPTNLFYHFTNSIAYHWRSGNLTCSEGGGGIETVGAIEGIDAMLLQSEGNVLRIFPEWPTNRNASFKRLRAKGAFVISSGMTNGIVTSVDLTSEKGQGVTMLNPWSGTPTVSQVDTNGNFLASVSFALTNGNIVFSTTAGACYLLTGAPAAFSISATPLQTVTVGNTNVSYTVNLTTNSGFGGSVNLSVSGLPPNASANFIPASLNANGSATLTVGISNSTPVGNYTLTITGAGISGTNSTVISLAINSVITNSFTGGTNIFEAEFLTIDGNSGDTIATNSEVQASNGQYVQYFSTSVNDYITFRVPNVPAGSYAVTIGYKRNSNRGIIQTLAGAAGGALSNLGSPFDQYGSSAFLSTNIGTMTIATSGDQDFEFLVTAKNASSSGYNLTVDYIKLVGIFVDSDGDGIPDWWTLQFFGHATGQVADKSRATDDADGDGVNNLDEYLAGTNPTNAASYFHLISVASQTNNTTLTWTVVGGHSYVVQSATNLAGGFSDIGKAISISGAGEFTTNFTANITNSATEFYRVRLGP